jgi:predicted enzyme related to lactoylglutathione lyase
MNQTQIATRGIDAHFYLAKDFDRALAFYRDVLGLPVATQYPGAVEFELGDGSTFGISIMPDGRWYPGGGVMFSVDDVPEAVERLRAAGIKLYTDGTLDTPNCQVAWCEDPEGNNFAVHQRK